MTHAVPRWLALPLCLFAVNAPTSDRFVCDCATASIPDCVAGNDVNSGTSPSAPLQSYEAARLAFGGLGAGDSIRFCRGGSWEVATTADRWVNTNCRADTPCTVGAYVADWATADSSLPWIRRQTDDNGFALQDGGSAEHEEGYVFEDLRISSSVGVGATNSGFLLQNDIDDIVIQRVVIEGFRIGVHVAGSNTCSADPLCDALNERIVLRESHVEGNHSFGWLGGSNGSQIVDSHFINNGSLAVYDHNIYVSATSTGMRIVGNHLYQATLDADGNCDAVSLVVHGEHSDLLIEGNEVREDVGKVRPGCWGIAVDPGYSEPEAFTDITIRGNRLQNVGRIAIGVASCQRCVIENNLIVQENATADFQSIGIAAPDRNRAANDLAMDDITIRNNAVYFGTATAGIGIRLFEEGDDHLLVSNAIHYAGSGNFACFDVDSLPSRYQAMDHNLCFAPAATSVDWVRNTATLAEWQLATGFDAHSGMLDPGFNNPASADLYPVSSLSAMVNAGDPVNSSVTDVSGVERDAAPDIGAWEWQASTVAGLFADGFESP